MKKLLLASTAVVLSAGVAAADVTLSGDAWMGLGYDNSLTSNKIQTISRARVTFTLSGETDAGMAFGASFRADNAVGAADSVNSTIGRPNMNAGSVFISGDFGRLAMGDVDSALEATWFRTRHIGVLENAGGSRTAALGSGQNAAALYTYSMEGFTVALGTSQFRSGAQAYSIGAKYEMDGYGVAVGFERNGAGDRHILISGQANFDPVSVRAFAGQLRSGGVNNNQYGLDVHASFDGIGVQVRGKRDFAGDNHLGAGVTYGLGGGATLGASVNRVSGGSTTADLGLAFSF
ncbi:MAG: porin [Roseinatronobacter sp.]